MLFRLLIVLTSIADSDLLNVTVRPRPQVECVAGEEVRLVCETRGAREGSVVVLRWVVAPQQEEERQEAEPKEQQEFLLVKLNVRGAEFWGNYTQRSLPSRFQLHHDHPGHAYSLLLSNVTHADRGRYSCRAQEVRRHRNRWRALSNGTAHTQLRVHHVEGVDCIWCLFQDVYLCAAVLCSIGLVSILLFAVVLACQHLAHRPHPKDSYSLVKSPDSSSGETVTSLTSEGSRVSSGGHGRLSSSSSSSSSNTRKIIAVTPMDHLGPVAPPRGKVSSSRPHRKQKRHKHPPPPPDPPDAPPDVPVKAPRLQKPRRTKLLKAQTRRTAAMPEDSLTYAELELVKARTQPEPKPEVQEDASSTVYAQILFP